MEECRHREDWPKWKEAIDCELKSLAKRKVFGPVVLTPCHAPIPSPTQLADPNRVRVARPDTGTLYQIFFKAELVPVGMAHIL